MIACLITLFIIVINAKLSRDSSDDDWIGITFAFYVFLVLKSFCVRSYSFEIRSLNVSTLSGLNRLAFSRVLYFEPC